MTEQEINDQFMRYLDLGLREGWSDPVGFALNRLVEWKRARKEHCDGCRCEENGQHELQPIGSRT